MSTVEANQNSYSSLLVVLSSKYCEKEDIFKDEEDIFLHPLYEF